MLPNHLARLIAETTGHTPAGLRRACRATPLEPIAGLVLAAASALGGAETQLAAQIDLAQRALATAAQALAAGRQTNSLGILQNTGLGVDLLAARREQAADALNDALRAYTEAAAAQAAPEPGTPAAPPMPGPGEATI